MTRFCTSCGSQQSSHNAFCENCGAPLTKPTTSAPVAPPPISLQDSGTPAAGSKGFPVKAVVGVVIAALLVVAGLMGLWMSGGVSGPGATAKEFFWALEQGDVEEARGHLSGELRALLNEQKLNTVLGQSKTKLAKLGGLKDVQVVNETINGTTAVVEIRLLYGNGSEEQESTKMVQEDGEWKITADK